MKDEIKIVNTGNVKISEDVVVSIVTIAANEIDGVKVTSASALDFAELWGKKVGSRGVHVVFEDQYADVDICVQMRYGVKIPQTALKVQQNIKDAIESMTGLTARKINVTVSGVSFEKEKKGE